VRFRDVFARGLRSPARCLTKNSFEELQPQRNLSSPRYAQVFFALQNGDTRAFQSAGSSWEVNPLYPARTSRSHRVAWSTEGRFA